MNTILRLRLVLAVLAALGCVQCSSTPQSRIEKNPGLFLKLNARDRQLVQSGSVREGMSRDAVFLAWGRPDSVSVGANRGRQKESWTYFGQRPIRTMSMNMGFGFGGFGGFYPYGWGPYGWGYPSPYWGGGGQSVTYVPYTAGQVDFSSGRVSHWETTSR